MREEWKVDTYQNHWGLFAESYLVPFLLAGKPDPLILLRDLRAVDRILLGPLAGTNEGAGSRVYVFQSDKEQTELEVHWIDPESEQFVNISIGHML